MKIKFSREVPYTPEWNGNRELPEGERVETVIKPMTVADLLIVMEAMGRKPGVEAAPDQGIDVGRLISEAGSLLPRYVTLTGLEDEAGPVSTSDLLTFGAFLPLAAELLMQCAKVSMPSENVAEKNS